MKKLERFFGIFSVSIFIIAYIAKMQHWPGAGIGLFLSFFFFNFFFLPINLISDWRKAELRISKVYYITRFVFFFITFSAFIFKNLHWSAGGYFVIVSQYLVPVFFAIYFIRRYRERLISSTYINDLLITVLAVLFWHFVNTIFLSPGVLNSFVFQEEQYKSINTGIKSANNSIYESISKLEINDNNKDIINSLKKTEELSDSINVYIKEFRYRLIEEVEGWDKPMVDTLPFELLDKKADYKITKLYLIGNNSSVEIKKGPYTANDLKEKINHYINSLKSILTQQNINPDIVGLGLNTDDREDIYGNIVKWERQYFLNYFANSLSNITYFENLLYLTEYNCINALLSKIDLSQETKFLQDLAQKDAQRAIKENKDELMVLRQKQELHDLQLTKNKTEIRHQQTLMIFVTFAVLFVIVLLVLSTRAYHNKQKDNKKLEEQKKKIEDQKNFIEEFNESLKLQNEEISSQRDEIEAQRDEILLQKDNVEKAHEHIQESINYAKRIQSAVLPPEAYINELLPEHFILYLPRDIVSGDFYWIRQIHDQIILIAADCTGHGVPGAFMSMLGVSFLNEVIIKREIIDAGEILNELRKLVKRSLRQTGKSEEAKDGMDMSVCVIDTKTKAMQYAGAYNPLYIIRNNELKEFKADRMPVGIHAIEKSSFTNHEFQLIKNDTIYLLSDGYADQFGGPDGKKYLTKRLKSFLISINDLTMSSQKQQLEKEIDTWKKAYEQTDDILVMGIKI